ncbi:MAG: hypothetical protein IPM57_11260 [Oligoflexia bacterium]|nr:hypothetical protein [Oligoflexia bacterium]
MIQTKFLASGFNIKGIESCDFSSMDLITTDDLLVRFGKNSTKLSTFVKNEIQIDTRYFVKNNQDALDLARQALGRLIEKNPDAKNVDFFIFAGISNPMPTVCLAALLSNDFGITGASCWDLKSGCSSGVLALQQAIDWFGKGAKSGIIVASETFSKFTNQEIFQMSLTTGDGACAVYLTNEPVYKPIATIHGTDATYFKSTFVPGKYPIVLSNYNPSDYQFVFSEKSDVLKALQKYWSYSLNELLMKGKCKGEDIKYYFSHQVDSKKNLEFAKSCKIAEAAVLNTFKKYGNIGCPGVFLNYLERKDDFKPGKDDYIVFQAVGGGLSWASLLIQKLVP